MQGGTPNELLARIALANGPAIIQRNLAILRSNLELVVEFFSRHHQRFEFVKPRVGTVCFPRLTAKGDEAEGYCTALAEEHFPITWASEEGKQAQQQVRSAFLLSHCVMPSE